MLTPERRAELQAMLAQMSAASSVFYGNAVRIGMHPFIEFTGLMNEYVQLCRDLLEDEIDFTEVSTHGSPPEGLRMRPYRAAYLGEKLGCIFEPFWQADRAGCATLLRAAGMLR